MPSYVKIARATASEGYTVITVNTRMHDIGSVLAYRSEGAVRGGSYWGLPSKTPLDIAAWVAYARSRGYPQVVLVGHSAGGPAVLRYQAERREPRVIGLAMASVAVGPSPPRPDAVALKTALDMIASGRGNDFLPNLRLSAATFVDYAQTPSDMWDFYGTNPSTKNPAITHVRAPLLAWFGSRETNIGTAADLERIRTLIARHQQGPIRVDTQIIEGADHLYTGHEAQVASILGTWIRQLPVAAVH